MNVLRVLTIGDLCARLARSRSEVLRLRREDPAFPRAFRLRPGGDDVFDLADVDRWIDGRKAASAEEDGETPGVRAAVARLLTGPDPEDAPRAPRGGPRPARPAGA